MLTEDFEIESKDKEIFSLKLKCKFKPFSIKDVMLSVVEASQHES